MVNQFQVTVLLGGRSAEREVSLRSGAAVVRALRALGHVVDEVDPAGESWVLPAKTEVVFLVLHGEYGEDGQVQSRLETLGVPYTGTDAAGSALAFDKARSKERFQQNQVASPRGVLIDSLTSTPPDSIPAPWILKPAAQGSSVGLNRVEEEADVRLGRLGEQRQHERRARYVHDCGLLCDASMEKKKCEWR